jgi:hypothetical protein
MKITIDANRITIEGNKNHLESLAYILNHVANTPTGSLFQESSNYEPDLLILRRD